MATTVNYTASLCTRKTGYSSNAKSGAACQEYYDPSYNYAITEYDVRLWHGMVEFVTVYSKEDIRFTMKDGTEIRV